MPRLIATDAADQIELGDLVERLETEPFDARDEENFASWGPMLKKLANNRRFLGDLVIAELKERCEGQVRNNQYTPQVILLHGRSRSFTLRANFWPAMDDSVIRNSGTSPFFYGVPHDHNFSFLTVGYLGPGYWSEYYEYDYESTVGFIGEAIDLRFVEKSRLDPGKVMLYRAHRDVHNQLPADAMSISLNILEGSHSVPIRDQYRFDTATGTIAGLISALSAEQMLAVAAHFGGDNGRDLLEDYAANHPSERLRWVALKAQASALDQPEERLALWEGAARRDSRFLSAMAAREAATVERGRAWYEDRAVLSAA